MNDAQDTTKDGAWNETKYGKLVHEADAVFEGGGVKGVALVGAMLEFEAHGYTHWENVAGTSAGAILAAYIACGHGAADALDVIGRAPFQSFEDWGGGGLLIGGLGNLLKNHGLCRGDVFRDWMNDTLEGRTFGDLEEGRTLKMIATNLTQHRMLVLPESLALFRDPATGEPIDPDTFLIADAVRMSMAIPYFFAPKKLTTVGTDDEPSEECLIVDGGVVSNYPVWLFDCDPDKNPTRPTFGFKITGGEGFGAGADRVIRRLGWPVEEGEDIFHTTSEAWDAEFQTHATVVRTCPCPAGDLGTTDFTSVASKVNEVVAEARMKAATWIEGFNLAHYRNSNGRDIIAEE